MKRALHMPDELGDIVQGKPWFGITEIAGHYLEDLPPGGGVTAFQTRRSVSLTISRKGRPKRRASVLSLAATSSSRVNVVRMT